MIRTCSNPDMVGGALTILSQLGGKVFPLKPRSKQPATANGFKDATDDLNTVSDWWSENPSYNIGLATGRVVVVDVDDHSGDGGANGWDFVNRWEAENGELPNTVTVSTGRGSGTHIYFNNVHNIKIPCCARNEIACDIRGFGGYVVAPPSIHPSGEEYAYTVSPDTVSIAPIDDHVLSFIQAIQHSNKTSKRGTTQGASIIPEGERDSTLFSYACAMQDRGVPDDEMEAKLREINETQCCPPLNDSEVIAKARSAQKYPKGDGGAFFPLFDSARVTISVVNDKGLADLFATAFGGVVAYVPEIKSWYAFNGKYWTRDGAEQYVQILMKNLVDALICYAKSMVEENMAASMLKGVARYLGYRGRQNVIEDAKSELAKSWAEFDKHPYYFNCLNGTLDLSEDVPALKSHDARDLLTKCAPVRFDINATCDKYRAVAARAFEGDADMCEYWQKLCGKVISGDVRDDVFHFMGEQPRTGKGCLTQPLITMLGVSSSGYGRQAAPESFAVKRFANGSGPSGDIARLQGARLVLTTEPPEGMELNASLIKSMTGGDFLTARFGYGEDVNFQMEGQMIMTCNSFPIIRDSSVFTSGRVRIIPLDRSIPAEERDATLKDRLTEPSALSGLLNYCLEGIALCNESGFLPCGRVAAATEIFEIRSDDVARFIGECLERKDGAITRGSEIYREYSRWATRNDLDALGKPAFFARLKQRVSWISHNKRGSNLVNGWVIKQ